MFKENKYSGWYYNIINNVRMRPPPPTKEMHHIIPSCIGGRDIPSNLIALTYKEHYICHLLLTKMTSGQNRKRMEYAFWNMSNGRGNPSRYIPNSTLYEVARIKFIRLRKENMLGERNHFYGKKHNSDSLIKMSENNPMHREEVREKCKGPRVGFMPHNHFNGWSEEVKNKISESLSGRKASEKTKEKMRLAKSNLVWVFKNKIKPKQIKMEDLGPNITNGWTRGRGPRKYW